MSDDLASRFCVNLRLPVEVPKSLVVLVPDPPTLQQFALKTSALPAALHELLARYNIELKKPDLFFTPPGKHLGIHSDVDGVVPITKLNWCYGAEGSYMTWWKPIAPGKKKYTGVNTPYLKYVIEDCQKVVSAPIGSPSIVDARTPHSVTNLTTESRWVLSCTLWDKGRNTYLTMAEAVRRLSEFRA